MWTICCAILSPCWFQPDKRPTVKEILETPLMQRSLIKSSKLEKDLGSRYLARLFEVRPHRVLEI